MLFKGYSLNTHLQTVEAWRVLFSDVYFLTVINAKFEYDVIIK